MTFRFSGNYFMNEMTFRFSHNSFLMLDDIWFQWQEVSNLWWNFSYKSFLMKWHFVSVTSRPMGEYEMDGEACWFVGQPRMQVNSINFYSTKIYSFYQIRSKMRSSWKSREGRGVLGVLAKIFWGGTCGCQKI